MLRKLSGRILECHALRSVALKSQRLRTRTLDILNRYQSQLSTSQKQTGLAETAEQRASGAGNSAVAEEAAAAKARQNEHTISLQVRLCACLALLYVGWLGGQGEGGCGGGGLTIGSCNRAEGPVSAFACLTSLRRR